MSIAATGALSYASIETALRSYLGDLTGAVGGYLLGGFGAPGLLPTIAFQIDNLGGSMGYPALLQLLNLLTGPGTPITNNLDYYLGNALNTILGPIKLLLLPLAVVYLAETGQLFF